MGGGLVGAVWDASVLRCEDAGAVLRWMETCNGRIGQAARSVVRGLVVAGWLGEVSFVGRCWGVWLPGDRYWLC